MRNTDNFPAHFFLNGKITFQLFSIWRPSAYRPKLFRSHSSPLCLATIHRSRRKRSLSSPNAVKQATHPTISALATLFLAPRPAFGRQRERDDNHGRDSRRIPVGRYDPDFLQLSLRVQGCLKHMLCDGALSFDQQHGPQEVRRVLFHFHNLAVQTRFYILSRICLGVRMGNGDQQGAQPRSHHKTQSTKNTVKFHSVLGSVDLSTVSY